MLKARKRDICYCKNDYFKENKDKKGCKKDFVKLMSILQHMMRIKYERSQEDMVNQGYGQSKPV